jgi:tRNA nucleotidyltransferase (CCA-adding enzyme)
MPYGAFPRLPESAAVVLKALEDAGHEAWVVGGWVRDALMGRPSHDLDVTTSALWPQTAAALEKAGIPSKPTGVKHGTVTALVNHEPVEVTTYRVDGDYTDSRHPDSVVFVRDVVEDLARRDFTINAMAYHPVRGLLDPFGGEKDIDARLIRAVGDPFVRMDEDALRCLRAVRFAARFRFSIDEATQAAVDFNAPRLSQVSNERIGQEIGGILETGRGGWALRNQQPVMFSAIPELKAMKDFSQRSPYHAYDVLNHVARVMDYVEVYSGGTATPAMRWCGLLHDIAKPVTLTVDPRGQGHFYGHPSKGAQKAQEIMRRLAIPGSVAKDACALVRVHDRPVYPTYPSVRALMRDLETYIPGRGIDLIYALLVIKRADAAGKAIPYIGWASTIDVIESMVKTVLKRGDAWSVKTLAISGSDVVASGRVPLGPQIGSTLEAALEAVVEGELPNEHDALVAALELGYFDEAILD